MDGSASQVHELHKKFEALNEDVAAALKVQHEALAGVAAASSSAGLGLSAKAGECAKKDALRLASRAVDWKEDVAALAKHIDSQLQHSRALRVHHANTQLLSPATAASSDRQLGDEESARLRRLRSDLRLLQSYRVSSSSGRDGGRGTSDQDGGGQATSADATANPVAEDTVRLLDAVGLVAFDGLTLSVMCRASEAAPDVPRVERQARESAASSFSHAAAAGGAAGGRAVRAPARAHAAGRRGRAARQAPARRRYRVRAS